MLSKDNKRKIEDALADLSNQELSAMIERYQILAEHIYPILVADKQIRFDVLTLLRKLTSLRLEDFESVGLMEDDVLIALALLIYGNDIDCEDGKFFAR